ncbi:hypothetical protein [Angustibacter aerolatus]
MRGRRTATLTFSLVLAAAVTGAQAAPAMAATGTAPSCILRGSYNDGLFRHYTATNTCGKTMRIKIVLDNQVDSKCTSVADRRSLDYKQSGGTYARTITC